VDIKGVRVGGWVVFSFRGWVGGKPFVCAHEESYKTLCMTFQCSQLAKSNCWLSREICSNFSWFLAEISLGKLIHMPAFSSRRTQTCNSTQIQIDKAHWKQRSKQFGMQIGETCTSWLNALRGQILFFWIRTWYINEIMEIKFKSFTIKNLGLFSFEYRDPRYFSLF